MTKTKEVERAEMVLAATQFDESFRDFFESIVTQAQFTPEQQLSLGEALKSGIERRDKIGNVLAWMEAQASAIREKEKHLAARRKHFEKFRENAISSLFQQMKDWGIERVEGNEWTFAIKKNPPHVEIEDEAKIPAEYLDYVPTISKARIKDALESGQQVEGAKLEASSRLEIK